jgi:DNA-binding CsgD family transcriptional regulator/tetratricopeptide (TPR) repeat protein
VADAPALTGLDRIGVLELTLQAAGDAGNEERGLQLCDQALGQLDWDAEPSRAALLLERKASLLLLLGRGDGTAELEQAISLLPEEPTRELAGVLAALARTVATQPGGGIEPARRAASVARSVGAKREESVALTSLGISLGLEGRFDEALTALEEALELARATGESDIVLRTYINLSDGLSGAGRHERAVEVASEGIELAGRFGLERSRGAFLRGNQAESLLRLGRWREAERVLEDAVAIDTMGVHAATLGLLQAEILVAQGRCHEALERARPAARVVADAGDLQYALPLLTVQAGAARALGELDEASELVGAGLARWSVLGVPRYAWPLVWTGLRIEDERAAQTAAPPGPAQELLALARDLPALQAEHKAYRALCSAHAASLDGRSERKPWEAAVEATRAAGDPYPLAYALVRLAALQILASERKAAALSLREASALAVTIGAEPLAVAAGEMARRAGLGQSAAAPGGGADGVGLGLTTRELEVLQLVAAGRSNADIASELFISPKTASVHVSNILAKLDVPGRVQAAALAHRMGLFGPSVGDGPKADTSTF